MEVEYIVTIITRSWLGDEDDETWGKRILTGLKLLGVTSRGERILLVKWKVDKIKKGR